MLETYDPNWEEKWHRVHTRVAQLNAKDCLTLEDAAELHNLTPLLCTIVDAGLKMPDEYVQRHLSLTLPEADRLGIWAWWPQVPEDADFDTVRAAVRDVFTYVDTVKRRREIIARCRDVGMVPQYLPPVPPTDWRTRRAQLRFRLGRRRRLAAADRRRKQNFEAPEGLGAADLDNGLA
jgi:hypothetical protein